MLISDWIEHDGLAVPEGRIWRAETRRPVGSESPRWDWSGKAHRSEDVMRYNVLVDDAPALGSKLADTVGPSRASVLDAARAAVLRDRAATHGALENSFGDLALVWSVRLGVTVAPAQVALMLVDLKVTRAWGNPGHGDNWIDIAGYAACGGELAGGAA